MNKRMLLGDSYMNFIGRLYPESKDRLIKTITFQVTEDCNLACTYCYQICKDTNKLTIETAKEFIDRLFECSYDDNHTFSIKNTFGIILEFIGGEPLLEIELIDQITDYFKIRVIQLKHPWAKHFMASMISNGVLYFDPRVQDYIKKNRDRLSFSISLDGNKELHDACRVFHNGKGSYDIALKACKHFMENYDKNMYTKMTLAPENISHTFDAVKNLISLNYNFIHLNCIYEEGWNSSYATILYDQLKLITDYLIDNNLYNEHYFSIFSEIIGKEFHINDDKNYCGSSCAMLSVDHEGDIYPCIRFMKSSLGNDIEAYDIGNIKEGIGCSPVHKQKMDSLYSITRTSQSEQKCIDCKIATGCGWCTAYNYQVTGSVNKRVTHICDMHKARVLANVYYWNKIYKLNNSDERFKMNIPKEWALEIISEEEYNMLYDLQK